ncbi:MAG: TSUP family transporter, partial [Pseudomonadota bacterium]|nr:TSUP family transporter [Pseudomonadota bacterium]
MELLIVSLASLFAGLVDSIVGGGGLILVPALFATFPSAPPATLLGSNKSASIWGTTFATYQFSRQVEMRWAALIPAALTGVIGSLSGAWAITQIDPGFLRQALPFLLLALLGYTLAKKDMGQTHAPLFNRQQETYVTMLMGLVFGFYDGFFGPGTGSFFVFAYVRLLGYDFLNASASAKVMNS